VSFADDDETVVDSSFSARLGEIDLLAVTYVNSDSLTATVPATMPLGAHRLVVQDPQDEIGALEHAFTVVGCTGAGDCDDGDLCTDDACDGAVGCVRTPHCRVGESCAVGTGVCSLAPVTFQDGVSGYTGTQDTFIVNSSPDVTNGDLEHFEWDLEDPTGTPAPNYALVRFDDVFGDSVGQVPLGATILSATLTLVLTDESAVPAGEMYETITAWDEATTTWNNFGGVAGVQMDEIGTHVAQAPLVLPPCDRDTPPMCAVIEQIDVTASLLAWSGGAPNGGWIFEPASSNGLNVASSESPALDERPLLTVEFVVP